MLVIVIVEVVRATVDERGEVEGSEVWEWRAVEFCRNGEWEEGEKAMR